MRTIIGFIKQKKMMICVTSSCCNNNNNSSASTSSSSSTLMMMMMMMMVPSTQKLKQPVSLVTHHHPRFLRYLLLILLLSSSYSIIHTTSFLMKVNAFIITPTNHHIHSSSRSITSLSHSSELMTKTFITSCYHKEQQQHTSQRYQQYVQMQQNGKYIGMSTHLYQSSLSELSQQPVQSVQPQAFSSGYSTNPDLSIALYEAFHMAMKGLPSQSSSTSSSYNIDLAMIYISSLYDNAATSSTTTSTTATTTTPLSPANTVPILLAISSSSYEYPNVKIQNIIGCTVAGCISSQIINIPLDNNDNDKSVPSSCQTIELEAVPAVTITLGIIPDTIITTFHIAAPDLPDDNNSDDDNNTFNGNDSMKRPISLSDVKEFKRLLGLQSIQSIFDNNEQQVVPTAPTSFFLLPQTSFSTLHITSLLQLLSKYYPYCQIAGGISSTVSSLSRAKLFQWSNNKGSSTSTSYYTDGCIGIAFQGDVQWQILQAQGAKPVGGIYQIMKGQDSTIQIIQLDEVATQEVKEQEVDEVEDKDEDEDDDDEDNDENDTDDENTKKRKKMEVMAQFYAKAPIPKPPLAEANFIMKTLSDDDQAFMKRQLLVGLEDRRSLYSSSSSNNRIISELIRLSLGETHRFRIYNVASAGMKDGSITLPFIYKNQFEIYIGQRLRFYVREPNFAVKEINALWLGYQQRKLNSQYYNNKDNKDDNDKKNDNSIQSSSSNILFQPSACLIIPTLDRGHKFFQGQKHGYESYTASLALSNVQCITGFFSNGVIGSIMDYPTSATTTTTTTTTPSQPTIAATTSRPGIQGSASGYFLIGSWSGRPVYNAAAAAAVSTNAQKATNGKVNDNDSDINEKNGNDTMKLPSLTTIDQVSLSIPVSTSLSAAPRYENGELIIKRREVNSGRALTVSTIEWSVADKMAKPSSTLEGFMWEKETEVDRLRERIPMSQLMTQWRTSMIDPTSYKPRDWIGTIKNSISNNNGNFVIIPECKKMDPATTGSIRRRYDIPKLIRDFIISDVPALSVNCDSILFGGTIDHITTIRKESNLAAVEALTIQSSTSKSSSPILDDGALVPPILASDLILYPYQLYKLRLAGADAVNLIAGALESKDIVYLIKIAASLQLQILVTVTSDVQVQRILSSALPKNGLHGIIISNRQLEDYSFDMKGEQALRILKSESMKELREKEKDMIVLVEGRIGIIQRTNENDSIIPYIQELKDAGAMGAIVGGGLALANSSLETKELINKLRLKK